MSELVFIHLDPNYDDKHYIIHNGRKIYIAETNYPTEGQTITEVEYKGVLGSVTINLTGHGIGQHKRIYTHTISEGPYLGYSKKIVDGFYMQAKDLLSRFYPHYIKEKDGSIWRIAASTLEEAWEYSQQS
jgi:hypothetical protein